MTDDKNMNFEAYPGCDCGYDMVPKRITNNNGETEILWVCTHCGKKI